MGRVLTVGCLVAVGVARTAAPVHAATTERWSGSDRYATSVVVSESAFPSGASTVFIATGESFPDALAAGPVAAKLGAPILLTTTNQLPPAVSAELQRLGPSIVYLLGGSAAASAAVETQVSAATTADVRRVAGADRYATAAAVVEVGFASAEVVYVASGTGFADALSAGAPGGVLDRPVLLTTKNSLPAATQGQITRLANPDVIVLGGTAAVSDSVVAELDALTTGSVKRVSGDNRYETSVAVSVEAFDAADTVFLTTGQSFPDALSAAPAAAGLNAPILLTTPTCAPAETISEVDRLGADRIIVLGGTNAVSDAAAKLTRCRVAPPVTPPPAPTEPGPVYGQYCSNGAPIRSVPTSDKVVSFTFDDGPWPTNTAAVMSTFERYGWRANFFMIGSNVLRYPDIARSVVRRGHGVAAHSVSHSYSPATIASEVGRSRDIIQSVTGVRTSFFRSPGLTLSSTIDRAVYAAGMCNISTASDLGDWRSPRASSWTLCDRVRRNLRPGAIFLLHDGGSHRQTVDAISCMLDTVRRNGYQIVDLGALLSRRPP
jgi:putative cell wall-binding protein/peptidoglycan/xylan/chitin deacetylase (PgdA/CDA1 family)